MNMGIMLLIVVLFGICCLMTVAALFFKDKPEAGGDVPPEGKKKD